MDAATISPAQGDHRSGEILDRIKSVFAAKGFDGASMQDLAQAAGMSAGNFYRYFPSKNAIIEALAHRNLERMEGDFERIRRSADPRREFSQVLRARVETLACEDAPIWAEITAASYRKPEIAALQKRMEEQVVANLVAAFAKITGLGQAEARERFSMHARLVVLLVQGLSCNARPAQGQSEAEQAASRELVEHVLGLIEATVEGLPRADAGQAAAS